MLPQPHRPCEIKNHDNIIGKKARSYSGTCMPRAHGHNSQVNRAARHLTLLTPGLDSATLFIRLQGNTQ